MTQSVVERWQRLASMRPQEVSLAEAGIARVVVHRLLVGQHHGTVFDIDALRPEEHFRGSRLQTVFDPVENVPQNHLRRVVDERWRNGDLVTKEIEVEGLERRRGKKLAPETQHHAIVLARVLVRDGRDLLLRHVAARRVDQARVQSTFRGA